MGGALLAHCAAFMNPHHDISQIARELSVRPAQVQAAVDLLDGGATVPFIARYRKEATGGLDDTQLRTLEERLAYLRDLAQRRTAILKSVSEQGQLTDELAAALGQAATKQALEDLYAPYKPKRRTKAMIAREAGLAPLADALLANPGQDPASAAAAYLNAEAGFADAAAVLDGVRDIWAECWAEDATLVQALREWWWATALLKTRLADGVNPDAPEPAKFRDYFDYAEPVAQVPSHRALAAFRGQAQNVLSLGLGLTEEPAPGQAHPGEGHIAAHLRRAGLWTGEELGHAAGTAQTVAMLVAKAVRWTWRVKLSLSLERDLLARLRERSEEVAIQVFAANLRSVLLVSPAGPKVVMGLDPGIRTGVKVAVVGTTGEVLATDTVYPHEPRKDWDGALQTLHRLVQQHGVQLVAIGNGTASRETDQLAAELLKRVNPVALPLGQPLQKLVVSEAGASVYSASEFASRELPELDVSLRGAVSIARRLQDPLAELVKIDPKSIGVGQYQHDVSPFALARKLDAVVEDCVNTVGVDLNTASVPLLTRVSGLSARLAEALVAHRQAHGAFASRAALREVPGLGPKTFEQAAGFLRIRGGVQPLDASAVHPESYPVVERILAHLRQPITSVMGRAEVIRSLKPEAFAADGVGAITVRDILAELEKPGRDPRGEFVVAGFNDGVTELRDLKPGQWLDGTVTNVAAFGAFVDVGVHQDGLVHISQLADHFVQDPHQVVRAGQVVRVRVVEVDLARKRIALSMRQSQASDPPGSNPAADERRAAGARRQRPSRMAEPLQGAMQGALADLRSRWSGRG
jgi:uncharacterized protein